MVSIAHYNTQSIFLVKCMTSFSSLFLQNVDFVLKAIKKKKPDAFIALAGPEMLGEGPLFSPVLAGTSLSLGRLNAVHRT